MQNHTEISIALRIKQIRVAKGLTQKEFAQALGIVQGFLSGIERGKKAPSITLIYALCHKFRVDEAWLLEGSGNIFTGESAPEQSGASPSGGSIPLLDKIPSGFPVTGITDRILTYIELPDIPTGCYAIIAEGDYMAPTIRDGDIIIFHPGLEPKNRSISLLSNRWGEMILRRCRITGAETVFAPDNSIYAPFSPGLNTRIFGTVVEIWRKVKF